MTAPLTWRNVSTPLLRDFVGLDGAQGVARIFQAKDKGEWRWSVYAIVPGRPGVTSGYEIDPKGARRKVEAAWAIAKAYGRPVRTATTADECRHLARVQSPDVAARGGECLMLDRNASGRAPRGTCGLVET